MAGLRRETRMSCMLASLDARTSSRSTGGRATARENTAMPPSKRRRTTAAAASDTPLVHLDGGEPHPAPFVALWRAGRLTDTVVHVEGEAFPASRNVLAAGSAFFDGIFGSGMRDEHEPEVREMAASAFRPCLGFIYEGSCAV